VKKERKKKKKREREREKDYIKERGTNKQEKTS